MVALGLEEKQTIVCNILAKKVREYFQNEDNRKAFEVWYKNKYGKDYEWRK